MLVREIQALIRQSLDKVEELDLPKVQFEYVRKIIIRIAFAAGVAGLHSSAKNGK